MAGVSAARDGEGPLVDRCPACARRAIFFVAYRPDAVRWACLYDLCGWFRWQRIRARGGPE